jgi:hypothetical protein
LWSTWHATAIASSHLALHCFPSHSIGISDICCLQCCLPNLLLQTEKGSLLQALPEEEVPEIQRVHLAHAVLQLKAAGIDSIMTYPWLESPPAEAAVRALEQLYVLGAINEDAKCALQTFKEVISGHSSFKSKSTLTHGALISHQPSQCVMLLLYWL